MFVLSSGMLCEIERYCSPVTDQNTSAFNFPIQLSLGPMIGAIAAGNTVVLKPSEGAPQSAMIMAKIIASALDSDTCTTVQGGLTQSKALLEQKWDKIFFTGAPKTGSIIAQKAAETLTPIALELGGRNPAFITRKANVALAARRLLWAKTMNAGQVCISQNYILVDREIVDQVIAELGKALKSFYPNGSHNNPDYAKIANKSAFNRIKAMLDNTSGKIVLGGKMDESTLYIEPTVVLVSSTKDSLITEESFGPLIPILPVDNLDQAISIANEVHAHPLSLMAFGDKSETDKILAGTRSGGASLNDGFYHAVIPTLAFGGVGDSGSGTYRGKASFDCFVHRRPITKTPYWMEMLLKIRYPPFEGTSKWNDFKKLGVTKPNFDREGNTKLGLFGWIFSLGGLLSGPGSSFYRKALVVIFAVAVKMLITGKRDLSVLYKW